MIKRRPQLLNDKTHQCVPYVAWTFWTYRHHGLARTTRIPTHTVTRSLTRQITCHGVNRLSCKCQDGIWRWCVTFNTLTAPYGTCRHATRPRGHSGNKIRASVTQYRQSFCSVYTAAYLGFFFVAELINYRYSSRVCISLYDFTLILQI